MTAPAVDRSRMFVRERESSTWKLTRAGWSSRAIAIRLGVCPRTVDRYRARMRKEKLR